MSATLDAIWDRTEAGRREAQRMHMAAVLAERAKPLARKARPVVHHAASIADVLGFVPVRVK